MTATFPTYAQLLLEGFSEKPETQVSRTEMEGGLAKQRRVRSRALVARPVQYVIPSTAEYSAFKDWINNTLAGGADWYFWTDPVDGLEKLARIKGGEYEGTPWGDDGKWIVKFTLETWQ
jgi:hypothetical protein